MATPEQYLLKGPMPEIKKQSKAQLKNEVEMWRAIWTWIPSEVKYYVARTRSLGATALFDTSVPFSIYLSFRGAQAPPQRTTNRLNPAKLPTQTRRTLSNILGLN